jgi:hypothetical protein
MRRVDSTSTVYCIYRSTTNRGWSCIAVKVSSGRDGQFEAMLAPVLLLTSSNWLVDINDLT